MTRSGRASDWVARFLPLVPDGGTVLDVAAGAGRHTLAAIGRGLAVVAVDRDTSALTALAASDQVEVAEADLEAEAWPFGDRRFDGVVVTNYLHRALLPTLVRAVAPGGVLVYETFARGQERYGRPTNPDFLLRPGELLETVRGELRVLAYEDLELEDPACVQRIAAVRSAAGTRRERTVMSAGR